MATRCSNRKYLIESIKTGSTCIYTGNIRNKPKGWRVIREVSNG